jgi:DHA1 family bicyclomycin/chloramphenicol resistance-like MFS transporter
MRILLLLSLLIGFPALATDMYLPALPTLQKLWGVPMDVANLTLGVFLVANSTMVLVYGPLSDRLGRKPVLFGGLIVFFLGTLSCSMAGSMTQLILSRALQGLGAASATTLSFAITRDLYTGIERQRVLGYMGVIFALCPMLAPTVGGWMLAFASWRFIFAVQMVLCGVAIIGVLRLTEPLKTTTTGGPLAVAKRYKVVLKNGHYLSLTAIFTLMLVPLFTYIGCAAEIYINGFDITAQEFGLHFGAISSGIMLGSMFSARAAGRMRNGVMLAISLAGPLCSSLFLLLVGPSAPYQFTMTMFVCTFCLGLNRPISTNLILDAVDSDVGAASSLMNFSYSTSGALFMTLIAQDWGAKTTMLGGVMLCGSLFPALALLWRVRRYGSIGRPRPVAEAEAHAEAGAA